MSNAPDLNARDFAFNQVIEAARPKALPERGESGMLFRGSVAAVIASAIVVVRNWLQPAAATTPQQPEEPFEIAAHQPSLQPGEESAPPGIMERTENEETDGDEEHDNAGTPVLPSILHQSPLFHASIPMPVQLPLRRTSQNDNAIDLPPLDLVFADTLTFKPAALGVVATPPNSGGGTGSGGGNGGSGGSGGNGAGGGTGGDGDGGSGEPRRNSAPTVSGPVLLGTLALSSALLIGLPELLRNADDADGDALNVMAMSVSSGRIVQLPTGSFMFVAGREDTGSVTFTYKITDGTEAVTSHAALTLVDLKAPQAGPVGSGTLVGTPSADTLIGTPDFDVIDAMEGDDLVIGRESRDIIFGGAGNDRIIAGDGDDIVLAGAGDDVVFGGKGDDTLLGEDGNDVLMGEEGADTLVGGAGNDVLLGGEDRDRMDGGSGRDLFVAEKGDGDDIIEGGDGIDTLELAQTSAAAVIDLAAGRALSADIGSDSISGIENAIGGAGNDTIVASDDSNDLTGGAGADIFVFRTVASIGSGSGRDRILDFEAGDKIDLDDIAKGLEDTIGDAFQKAAVHRFVLLGQDDPFTRPGQLKFSRDFGSDGPSPYTVLMGNVDDNGDVDFEIEIHGQHLFTMDDFRGHA